jgi:hypothetical protein
LAVSLTACSTFGDKRVEGPESVNSEFMGGDLKVTINKEVKSINIPTSWEDVTF